MAKGTASIKSTGGGGFRYEDYVGSRFVISMLSGEPVSDLIDGEITSVSFQNQSLGWKLDDLLLTTKTGPVQKKYSFSIKSNKQITTSGFPYDFTVKCREQYFDTSPNRIFDSSRDHLGIIFPTVSADVYADVKEFLNEARSQSYEKFLQSVHTAGIGNDTKRNLWESFNRSGDGSGSAIVQSEDITTLLRLIVPLHLLEDNKVGIFLCGKLLRDNKNGEDQKLWSRILDVVGESRTNGGELTKSYLADKLRMQFMLKEYPYFESDFEKLSRKSQTSIGAIRNVVGKDIKIDREDVVKDLLHGFSVARGFILHGESGIGKSGILKSAAEIESTNHFVLWLNARDLDYHSIGDVTNSLDLQFPLTELLRSVRDNNPLIIFDGINAEYSRDVLENISDLLHSCVGDSGDLKWRVIISCQTTSLLAINSILGKANISSFQDSELPKPDISPILNRYPAIPSSVQQRPGLIDILANLQYADTIARIVEKSSAHEEVWVSESQIIGAFWKNLIIGSKSNEMKQTLWQVAEKLGDSLNYEVSLVNIDDATCLRDLQSIGILDISDRDRISFKHDLYADWTRTRKLCSLSNPELAEFLTKSNRISNPIWQRALVFFFITEIEERSSDWLLKFESLLAASENLPMLWQIISNAIAHSEFATESLEMLCEKHLDANVRKMRLFLNAFLYSATVPDTNSINLLVRSFPNEVSENSLSTILRKPLPQLWIPILSVLLRRTPRLLACPNEMIQICDYWIKGNSKHRPFLPELSQISIHLTDANFRKDERISEWQGTIDAKIHTTFLSAAYILPEEVKSLLLNICKRSDTEQSRNKRHRPIHRFPGMPLSAGLSYEELPDPWTDGPKERIDDRFQKVLLQNNTLLPIILTMPDTAIEAILALLISEPKGDHWNDFTGGIESMERVESLEPPLYDKGPFLSFLIYNPSKGVELIVKLVNFCTDRWNDTNESAIKLTFDGIEEEWIGDSQTFNWHSNNHPSAKSVVSALMAFEQYLYSLIDEGKDYTWILEYIRQSSRSVAFLGVFLSVSKRNPSLFLEKFAYLLEVPEFYLWDKIQTTMGGRDSLLGGWNQELQITREQRFAWHNMPHRKEDLQSITFRNFVTDMKWREVYSPIRERWQKAETAKDSLTMPTDFLQNLANTFNAESLRLYKEGETQYVTTELPAELEEARRKDHLAYNKRMITLIFPSQCRELLDKHSSVSDEEFEKMWGKLNFIIQDSDDLDIESGGILNPFDSVCGFVAVLCMTENSRFLDRKDVREWYNRSLQKALTFHTPPLTDQDLYDESGWSYEAFIAEIIPMVYGRDGLNNYVRAATCRIILTGRPASIRILFANFVKQKNLQADEYYQILNLLIWKSMCFWDLIKKYNRSDDDNDLYDSNIRKLAVDFSEGKISNAKPDLTQIFDSKYKKAEDSPLSGIGYGKSFFLAFFLPGISSLPIIFNGEIQSEYELIFNDLFDITIAMTDPSFEDDPIRRHFPDHWDKWVLKTVAEIISHESNIDKSQSLWTRLFELDDENYYFIREFLLSWYQYNIEHPELRNVFNQCWNRMFDYAANSLQWNSAIGEYKPHGADRNNYLLGMFDYTHFCEFSSEPCDMNPSEDQILKWAQNNLRSRDCLHNFIAFLKKRGQPNLIVRGLPMIAAEIKDNRILSSVEDRLISLLEVTKEKYFDGVLADSSAISAFNSLLTKLVGISNQRAMHLASMV
jgi:hypothetical protein